MRIQGWSHFSCAPLFSNHSSLNQLSENDSLHPGSLLESSLTLKCDTNNPQLQLRMLYISLHTEPALICLWHN